VYAEKAVSPLTEVLFARGKPLESLAVIHDREKQFIALHLEGDR
jgi:hypothetical protein